MDGQIAAGESIVVVQAGAVPPRQHAGACADQRGELVAFHLAVDVRSPASFRVDEQVLVVRSDAEARYAAPARFVNMNVAGAWFRMTNSEWRQIEQRQAPRIETRIECEIVGAVKRVREPAVILDISEGGARVIADRHVGEARVELHVDESGSAMALPCLLLACTEQEGRSTLRLRFNQLSESQEQGVRRMIDRWSRNRETEQKAA